MNYQKLFLDILTHPAMQIVTGIIGYLIGNFFTIGRDKRREFNEAAAKFREVFNQALIDIRGRKYGFGVSLSDQIIETHQLADLNFRPYLRGEHLRQYNEAWEQYCYSCENLTSSGILNHTTHTDLEKDIKHLLTFTKYSLWRNVEFYWRRKVRSVRLKIFGPSKKEKESTEKLIKFYEDYYHNKKPLP